MFAGATERERKKIKYNVRIRLYTFASTSIFKRTQRPYPHSMQFCRYAVNFPVEIHSIKMKFPYQVLVYVGSFALFCCCCFVLFLYYNSITIGWSTGTDSLWYICFILFTVCWILLLLLFSFVSFCISSLNSNHKIHKCNNIEHDLQNCAMS